MFFVTQVLRQPKQVLKLQENFFMKRAIHQKNRIITFEGAFHGRTLASLFAAKNPDHIKRIWSRC